jgi:hypothetical protein
MKMVVSSLSVEPPVTTRLAGQPQQETPLPAAWTRARKAANTSAHGDTDAGTSTQLSEAS